MDSKRQHFEKGEPQVTMKSRRLFNVDVDIDLELTIDPAPPTPRTMIFLYLMVCRLQKK